MDKQQQSTNNKSIINKLNDDLIRKVCAGEVIHRPLNVVKELIENSLDAGATMISITLRDGGLDQIKVQDNGCGMNKEDLKIVCDRFTTSKLKTMDDFNSLSTFGFRGEALASIAVVAQVTIISKKQDSVCGYKAEYVDGHLKDSSQPIVPIASSNGTLIQVDNLFYNMPTRKAALSSENQEYSSIQDLVFKYSLIFSGKCGFKLKKSNENCHSVSVNSSTTLFQNIDQLYGNISKNLLPINLSNEKLEYKINGYFTKQTVNLKKFTFILSINSRLVECDFLKRSLKELYKEFLLIDGHPFVIIWIEINPKNIDVNIHPSKNEVCFLHDTEIISSIIEFIREKLENKIDNDLIKKAEMNQSITDNYIQTQIDSKSTISEWSIKKPNPPAITSMNNSIKNNVQENSSKSLPVDEKCENIPVKEIEMAPKPVATKPKLLKPNRTCRIDSTVQRLKSYLRSEGNELQRRRRRIELTSIDDLMKDLNQIIDTDLVEILNESNYVGCLHKNFLLIQHELDLIMIDMPKLNYELFYQIFLIQFGNFDYYRFKQPLSMKKLLQCYCEVNKMKIDNNKTSIDEMIETITSKPEMLDDYFSIKINEENLTIETLPIMIPNYEPNYIYLPEFIYGMANNVNWKKEKECFETFGRELAKFYSYAPNVTDENDIKFRSWLNIVETQIFPRYKKLLSPTKQLPDDSIYSIANVTELYKVFERC